MKNNSKSYKWIAASLLIISATTIGVCAPPPPSVPFDGGISLIIGAGIVVAIKKMFFK